MKIEVNLSGIFADEDGNEVNDTVRSEIIENVTEKIYLSMHKEIEKTVNEILTKGITERLKSHLDILIPQLMDFEFVETTSWGETKNKWTVKNRLLNVLEKMCEYEKNSGRYNSDCNAFTRSVKDVVDEKFKTFKEEYNKKVDAEFTDSALAFASKKLRETLGIK